MISYARKRTPAHRVEASVNVKHRSHSFACGRWLNVVPGRWRVSLQQRTNDEEQDAHADGRDEKRESTTESVREEENEEECGNELDDAIDTGC